MDEVNDDAKASFRCIEVLPGPGRRRRWSAEEKARIVAETLEPGARVSEVARRWQVCAQQVFGRRRQARVNLAGSSVEPDERSLPPFVPLVSEAAAPSSRGHIRVIGTSDYFALWVDDGCVDVSVPLTPASARVLADLLLAISSPERSNALRSFRDGVVSEPARLPNATA
jgi:transposase